jgi:hypothetical protein
VTDIDLDAIRARASAATKGPWRWAGNVDHDDPRLIGRGGDIFGHIPRERQRTDRAAEVYANYLRELSVSDVLTGGWRSFTEEEIEEHVETDWLTDQWGEPMKDERMAFYGEPGPFYHDARELAIFAVCPEATDRSDPRVYRADITGLRNPNAVFIAAARQDIEDLLAEVDRLREANANLIRNAEILADELVFGTTPEWGGAS